MADWIPCSERLPDKAGKYLVSHYDYFDGYTVDQYSWADGWNRTPGDNGEHEIVSDNFKAWMPMPEPWMPFTAEQLRNEKMEEDARDIALEMGREE